MDNFRLGSDPEQLFPYKMMLEHLRKFARQGLIRASAVLPMIIADVSHVSTLNWDKISEDFMQNQEIESDTYIQPDSSIEKKFNTRMRDIIIDMIRLEYI